MSKVLKDIELSDEALAFEMIELTCDEMDSLTRAFDMISRLCDELNEEIQREQPVPDESEIH